MKNKFLKKVGATAAAAGVTFMAAAGSAMAALPPEIATTVAAAKSDVTDAGALIIGVVVAIAAVAWLRRVIR